MIPARRRRRTAHRSRRAAGQRQARRRCSRRSGAWRAGPRRARRRRRRAESAGAASPSSATAVNTAIRAAAAARRGCGRPACAARPSRTRLGQADHDRRQGGAGDRSGGDQCCHDLQRIGKCDERAGARQQRQDERDCPIAADARIAHDAQLVLARAPAAEAVGDVGQAILVQRAGNADGGRQCEGGGRPGWQAEPVGERIGEAARETDQRADHGKQRHARGEVGITPCLPLAHRQAGQKGERHLAVVDQVGDHTIVPGRSGDDRDPAGCKL